MPLPPVITSGPGGGDAAAPRVPPLRNRGRNIAFARGLRRCVVRRL
ncbi:hypothetical protein T261_3910 [Streptomyces lydicus]|nr:hypothetical protein T261_3910 [Streptomyces lydicus]